MKSKLFITIFLYFQLKLLEALQLLSHLVRLFLPIMEVDEDLHSTEPVPSYLTVLMTDSSPTEWLSSIIDLKNAVIGSNREKTRAIEQGLVPRLLSWVEDGLCPLDLKTEAAIVLGSLAKGGNDSVQKLVDAKAVPILLKSLCSSNLKYYEAVLRCLRSIFIENSECIDIVYEENSFGSSYVPTLLTMAQQSQVCQECVTNILVCCCKTKDHQTCLLNSQALPILSPLLQSNQYKIQMPTLRFFAKLCYKNYDVCTDIAKDNKLIETFVGLMSRDKTTEMQMAAAEMLTNLHRCGVIAASDFIISRKTLGTLVRMCMRDRTVEENVRGAEILAYLIEIDPELQLTASYTFHLIGALANCLHYRDTDKKLASSVSGSNKDVDWGSEMRRAAFLAFASISANDKDIREKVIKQEGMIEHIQTSLICGNDREVAASLRCLQSLTRSVQQIRTVLHDNAVWKPLLDKVRSGNKEIMILAMSCLCNLVLEFSPSKEALVENHAVDVLCSLSRSEDNIVRLNATWGLMSMSYCASEELRTNIVSKLGTDTLVKRIQDPVLLIREKALCIVRNLLAGKMSIDNTVKQLGNEVIEAVFKILSDHDMPSSIVTQALCALSNMADGPSCKAYIIAKTDEINAVVKYLQYPDKDLQLPAIQFVSNLVDTSDDGSYQRMLQLKTLGVQTLLESLVGTGLEEVEVRAQQALKYFA